MTIAGRLTLNYAFIMNSRFKFLGKIALNVGKETLALRFSALNDSVSQRFSVDSRVFPSIQFGGLNSFCLGSNSTTQTSLILPLLAARHRANLGQLILALDQTDRQ
jgi:hypothetical protein